MEILSPAGNLQHIELAIAKKVDAVYGGVKNWNARNKAVNFSIDEYYDVVKKVHDNGIKFYLTLNTLVFDEEINDIINFLKAKDTILPDAFIVADVGLILKLKKAFPKIPLHFSTQFGTHNISDCELAKILGAERVILSRELTMNEIKNIKSKTTLEIEVFVWGSQCISFSGMCFFGSLINCGNGNRGKCIITCRDFYQALNQKGHFLYVPDLNCTGMINELNRNNINCIKLEGRRRNTQELSEIIDDIKCGKVDNSCQNGYIYGETLKENKLSERISSRVRPIFKANELNNISKYDVFIKYKEDVPQEIIFGDCVNFKDKNDYYVFSEFKQQFEYEKKNIMLELSIDGEIIKKVLYVNSNGEGKTIEETSQNDYYTFNLEKLVKDISDIASSINLYKVKYVRNKINKYKISRKLYLNILNIIENDRANEKNALPVNNKKFKIKNLFVETDRIDYASILKENSSIKVIYNISSTNNLKNIDTIKAQLGRNVIYKLPLFNFKSDNLYEYYEKLSNMPIMFTRPSQIYETKDIKFAKKYTDYTVYIWNSETLNFYKRYGINEFTASPELSYEKNTNIFENEKRQFIIAGKLPLVYTRQCFSNLFFCKKCNENMNNIKEIINIDKNISFDIVCKEDYRMIISKEPILNNFQFLSDFTEVSFRYVTTGQKLEEIISSIKELSEENYYGRMKETQIWNKSYEGNILESRC